MLDRRVLRGKPAKEGLESTAARPELPAYYEKHRYPWRCPSKTIKERHSERSELVRRTVGERHSERLPLRLL